MLLLAIKHLCRSSANNNKRVLVCVDNLCTLAVFSKGRSSRGRLGYLARKMSALLLVHKITLVLRWVPTLRNIADGPSRGRALALPSDDDRQREREREEGKVKGKVMEESKFDGRHKKHY